MFVQVVLATGLLSLAVASQRQHLLFQMARAQQEKLCPTRLGQAPSLLSVLLACTKKRGLRFLNMLELDSDGEFFFTFLFFFILFKYRFLSLFAVTYIFSCPSWPDNSL